jgi:hypothetical protein
MGPWVYKRERREEAHQSSNMQLSERTPTRYVTWLESVYTDAHARTDALYRTAQTAYLQSGTEKPLIKYHAATSVFVQKHLLPRELMAKAAGEVGLPEILAKLDSVDPSLTAVDPSAFFTKKSDDVITVDELHWRLVTGDASHAVKNPSPYDLYVWVCSRLAMLDPVRVCRAVIALCRMGYLSEEAVHLWKHTVQSTERALKKLLEGPLPLRTLQPRELLQCFETSDSLE